MKRKLMPLVAMMLFTTAANNAFAASTGQLTFQGNVTNDTCTVTGLNQQVSFSNLEKSDIQDLAHLRMIERVNIPLSVASCPATLSKAILEANFRDAFVGRVEPEAGSDLRGIVVSFENGNDTTGNPTIRNNKPVKEDIVGGAATFNISARMARDSQNDRPTSAGAVVVPGTFTALLNLTMSYE
ncbi:hypothetical protein GJV08_01345 [Enterobacteriaceae bacterium RIT692]|nr:hypothetical protein [Enterobacteriaceae bacterium RIT692]